MSIDLFGLLKNLNFFWNEIELLYINCTRKLSHIIKKSFFSPTPINNSGYNILNMIRGFNWTIDVVPTLVCCALISFSVSMFL